MGFISRKAWHPAGVKVESNSCWLQNKKPNTLSMLPEAVTCSSLSGYVHSLILYVYCLMDDCLSLCMHSIRLSEVWCKKCLFLALENKNYVVRCTVFSWSVEGWNCFLKGHIRSCALKCKKGFSLSKLGKWEIVLSFYTFPEIRWHFCVGFLFCFFFFLLGCYTSSFLKLDS